MNSFSRFFYIHRPYWLGTSTILLTASLFFGWASRSQNDLPWLAISIFAFLILVLFWLIQVWYFVQSEQKVLPQVAKWMIRKGRISGEDQILFPYACDSRIAHPLIKHLTTGKLWLIDLYTPQLMTSMVTRRTRHQDTTPEKDPRLEIAPGDLELLPFQNEEIDIVILSNILNEITQFGDRERFLTELSRVIKPNGRILIYEPFKSTLRTLIFPPSILRLWSKKDLTHQLEQLSFTRIELQTPGTLTILGRAITPGRYENTQLPLEF